MKCRDCEKWGWGDDEGTPVWGWCWKYTSCPDPDIDRSCPDFSPKKPDIFTTLSTLQAENKKLRAELENYRKGHREEAISALSPPNEPLTIEQLREMDGEPVWCKWLLPEDRAIEQGKWFIVISGDKAGLEIKRPAEYGCHFCKIDDYGKTWLAYRRPPEGEEDK